MSGTIWIHALIGIVAFLITFGTALTGNVWLVSLERAVYAFILFFIASFPLRWLLAKMMETPPTSTQAEEDLPVSSSDQGKELPNPSESDPAEAFTPFSLAEFERVNPEQDPATVAEVVRRLTDE